MKLLFERSAARDFWGRPVYRLVISAEAHEVEIEIIDRHRMRDVDIWISSAFSAFENEAMAKFETAFEAERRSTAQVWRRLQLNRAGFRAMRTGYREEGRVTVDDLLGGIAMEARDVGELMNVEGGVRSGVEALQKRLDMLARFEDGDVLSIEAEPEDKGVAVTGWASMR